MSIEELSSKGSPACQEAFAYLRRELKAVGSVEETVEYEPLKETEAQATKFEKLREFECSLERNWKYSYSYLRKLPRISKPIR